jgi:hypothetical protein
MAITAAQRAAHDTHKKTAIGEADGCFDPQSKSAR